jgi:hypothetical protein
MEEDGCQETDHQEYLLNEDNFKAILFTEKAYIPGRRELINRFVANNNRLSDYVISNELVLTNSVSTQRDRIYVCKTVSIINLN